MLDIWVDFKIQQALLLLKMALKKQTFYNILAKSFLSDTPQSIKLQSKDPK